MYVESQKFPVRCRIARQQLKFWLKVQEYININPDSALKHFLDKALETNLPYIEHYKRLQLMNESPNKCLENHKNIFKDKWTSNLERSVEDIDSRLASYKQVNPTLTAPPYFKEILFETDRIFLTRFRCGSHSLFIEKGRFSNVPRCNREYVYVVQGYKIFYTVLLSVH